MNFIWIKAYVITTLLSKKLCNRYDQIQFVVRNIAKICTRIKFSKPRGEIILFI